MRTKPIVALATALCLSAPTPAIGGSSRTSFRAKTRGSPVATEIARWSLSEDERTATLRFTGGHLIGARTTFVARWVTRFTSPHEGPRYFDEYAFSSLNDLGEEVRLHYSFRFRERGKRWKPWATRSVTLPRGHTSGEGARGFLGYGRPMQFEWRLEGVIRAPTYLDGTYEGRIS